MTLRTSQNDKPKSKSKRHESSNKNKHCCPGEYCSLANLLDPNRDLVTTTKVIKSKKVEPKRNELHSHGRERAHRILKRILTKDELFALENSGDITRLRIVRAICLTDFKSVPKQCVERSRKEHRVAFLELQDTEDPASVHVWENSISDDDDNTHPIKVSDSMPSSTQISNSDNINVCDMCFHTYRLLSQVRCLQDVKFRDSMLNSSECAVFGLAQLLDDNNKTQTITPVKLKMKRNVEETKEKSIEPTETGSSQPKAAREMKEKEKIKEKSRVSKKRINQKKTSSVLLNPPATNRKINHDTTKYKIDNSAQSDNNEQIQSSTIKIFHLDDNITEIPYSILGDRENSTTQDSANTGRKRNRNAGVPKCNLIICHDLFETQERMQIYLMPFIERNRGHRILLWNYPGQAYTKFSDKQKLNNEYHAKCLEKLVDHVDLDGTNEFPTNEPFFILGHGQGGAIACLYAKSRQQPTLKGLILINPLSFVDKHFASVIHDCRNVFHCSPEERPDLPLYFYARFLFSDKYLQKTTTPLALNLYSAVHNPITLKGRIRLCEGVLDNFDLREVAKDIFAPIISIHGDDSGLVRPLHAASFLQNREQCTSIHQALYRKGGKRTVVITTQGGHELMQERKKLMCTIIGQLLTGNVFENKQRDLPLSATAKYDILPPSAVSSTKHLIDVVRKTAGAVSPPSPPKSLHSKISRPESGDKGQHVYNPGRIDHKKKVETSNMLIDPENPAFERQKNVVYKIGTGSMIYPAPGEQRKSQEYMSWRLKRNKKRLSRFQRSARVIQNSMRVYMAKTMMARLKRQTSANFIQRCFRGMIGRLIFMGKQKELWAAKLVQRMYRGSIGRQTSYYQRVIRKSQIHIARIWRGYTARKRVNKILRYRNYAATNLQSLWRRYASIQLVGLLKLWRNSATGIQRIYRGHVGRDKANIEREKYLFSRSQSRGIELGRQMLGEHKSQAVRLQSELSILEKEKSSLEQRVHHILNEISAFQKRANLLEKSMQEVSLVEVDLKSSIYTSARAAAGVSLRDKKVKLDQEFSSILKRMADRKSQLQSVKEKLSQLSLTKDKKEHALKMLERKLVVLLEAQENELDEIRRRQEHQDDNKLKMDNKKSMNTPSKSKNSSNLKTTSTPALDKQKTAQLMDSTETMMKFGFTSMTMTYFTALNMVKAMKSISTQDVDMLKETDFDNIQEHGGEKHTDKNIYMTNTQAPVSNWAVDHVIEWLYALSLGQYEEAFKDGSIDGPFLCQLTDDDLMNVLGIEHKLHRKKILFGISQLQNMPKNRPVETANTFVPGIVPVDLPVKNQAVMLPENSTAEPESELLGKIASKVELPPSLDDLYRWIRNKKYSIIKDALSSMESKLFDPAIVRLQFMEGIGTVYVQSVEDSAFHLSKYDEHGNTLMHVAAQNGNLRIAKLLMAKGANPNHQNKQGQTPGHFAVAYQFYDFASWLFDAGGGAGNDLLVNVHGLGPYDGLSPEVE